MSQWWIRADYYESCNCAHGCPCNTTAIPTDGTCHAIGAWHIREGALAGTSLNGLTLGMISYWPNPIHEGNGRAIVYIDERAREKQRQALTDIALGKAGPGGPFEIFASTRSEPARVVFGPITIERNGRRASLTLGKIGLAQFGPILSKMDGSEANVRLVMPDGFIFKDAELVNTDRCEVNADGLSFQHSNTNGFLSAVEYNLT